MTPRHPKIRPKQELVITNLSDHPLYVGPLAGAPAQLLGAYEQMTVPGSSMDELAKGLAQIVTAIVAGAGVNGPDYLAPPPARPWPPPFSRN